MRTSLEELHAYALSHRSLTDDAVAELSQVGFADPSVARDSIAAELSNVVTEFGLVQKCNAVILVVVAVPRHNGDLVRQRALDSWDRHARAGVLPVLPKISRYSGIDAVQFLIECAVGLHSLVTGDSQVLHQMTAIAPEGPRRGQAVLGKLAQCMARVACQVRAETGLNQGDLSAERLACSHVARHLDVHPGRTMVVGAGSSAELVTKILAQEQRREVVVVNRTAAEGRALAERRDAAFLTTDATFEGVEATAIVLAVPRSDETVTFARELLSALAREPSSLLVVDLSPEPLLDYGSVPVAAVTLSGIAGEARRQLASRQADVSRAHDLIRKQLPSVVQELDRRVAHSDSGGVRPLSSEKRQLITDRARILRAVRDLLVERGFVEITTPYVNDVASDPPRVNGGDAFPIDWFGQRKFLRQSDQVYKQMAIAAGAEKVYEIGPFWRSEQATSPRHVYETIGLDVERQLDEDGLGALIALAYDLVLSAAAVTPVPARLPVPGDLPLITYGEAVDELQHSNFAISYGDDLGHDSLSQLAAIVDHRYLSECFAVTGFPDVLRRFYARSAPGGLTESFDLVLRGWKLASGAVRENDVPTMTRNMLLSGLSPHQYEFYLAAVEWAPPHGGFGLGLDRLVARLLGAQSIIDAIVFP